MKVSVTVVSFNCKDFLKKTLTSLLSQKQKNQLEIWVVDNASLDNTVEMVEEGFKKVRLIKNPINGGFAKGQNLALKKITGDFALLLNPDTEIPEGVIDKMVEFMEQNPKCGIASCVIYDYSGKLQSNGGDLPFGLSLFSWLFNLEILGSLPNLHRMDKDYYTQSHSVGWVGGTFVLVKSQVFEKVGYLNEDYFMYFEDIEFCLRAKRAGFDVMINCDVSIKHKGGASSDDPRLRQWLGEFQGLLHFYKKEKGKVLATGLRLLVYFVIVLRIITFGLFGKFQISKTYGKVLFSI